MGWIGVITPSSASKDHSRMVVADFKEGFMNIAVMVTMAGLVAGGAAFMMKSASDREVELQRAAVDGRRWMEDTTTRLDSIQAGIEQMTADTLELAQELNALADRMEEAGI